MASNQIEQTIDSIYEFIEGCKEQTFSSSKIIVPKDELYDLLDELRLKTPDVIKRYQKIIANRDTIIAQAEERAEQIIEEAKAKAKQLVSEHEIMQQAYERAHELVSSAGAEADEMMANANADADSIRTGALNYANDIMANMEAILADSYETTRTQAENLIAVLKENYEVVSQNHSELNLQLHPDEVASAFDAPINTVTDEPEEEPEDEEEPIEEEEEFDFDEDTFLDNIDE